MMKSIYVILALGIFTFSSSQNLFNGKKVNTDPLNKEYRDSRKFIYGELNPKEYSDFKLILENELQTKIDEGKSVFINYEQAASNCSLLAGKKQYLKQYHKEYVRISNMISKKNNAVDFFIYNDDSFLKSRIEKTKNYKLDSGFFAKEMFTLKENCNAFFILKPDGKYMICYGTDSFSYASEFFRKK